MIAASDYLNARQWVARYQRPLLVSHRRPDGDALGALAGLALTLEAWNLSPQVALFEPFPDRYALLRAGPTWRMWEQERTNLTAECDALIVVDTCSGSQLGPIASFIPAAPPTLVIDHHTTSDAIGVRRSDLRLIDATAGAVCLLIAEWLAAADFTPTPAIATALFTGLATDTGWFRFPNTDARLFNAAASLTAAGAAGHEIYRAIYEQDAPARLRLIGRMLNTLELRAGERLAVLVLRQTDFAAAGADRSMTEDLVNEAARLASTEATLLFIEEPDGMVRVNFRSKRSLDVAALAQQFGGGGHARAAGARPLGAWDTLVPQIIAATEQALGA